MLVSSISRNINYATYNQIYCVLCACMKSKSISFGTQKKTRAHTWKSICNVTMFRKRLICVSIHNLSRNIDAITRITTTTKNIYSYNAVVVHKFADSFIG